ncbi:MAG: hypothetical protein JSS02_21795 [Planctomycetes bacterium]|nr:hypothetical protein [Planctomycetota bacterium]
MKTIETTAVIGPDRLLTVQLPADVTLGPHNILVVVDDLVQTRASRLDDFPTIDVGPWPSTISLRREDLYGESGR